LSRYGRIYKFSVSGGICPVLNFVNVARAVKKIGHHLLVAFGELHGKLAECSSAPGMGAIYRVKVPNAAGSGKR
jgi:hypothetical protein